MFELVILMASVLPIDERTYSFSKISFVGDNSVVWFPKKRFLVLRSKLAHKFL